MDIFLLVGTFGSSIHDKHPVLCIGSSTQAFPLRASSMTALPAPIS